MLKKIPPILSPELVKVIMEMGHGDELVIGDGNFPAASNARILLRADGHSVPELMEAILELFPLDYDSEYCMAVMETKDGTVPKIWEKFLLLAKKAGGEIGLEKIERFQFYERSRKAYAILATSEKELYANVILKKGCL